MSRLPQRQVRLHGDDFFGLQRTHGNGYVQRLVDAARTSGVPEGFESDLAALPVSGQPLPASDQQYFRPSFGDTSDVELHVSPAAQHLARSIGARAFTFGHSIVVDSDRFAQGDASGRRLLAHELAHVTQQRRMPPAGELRISDPDDASERQARAVAERITQSSQPGTANMAASEPCGKDGPAVAVGAVFADDLDWVQSVSIARDDSDTTAPIVTGTTIAVLEPDVLLLDGSSAEEIQIAARAYGSRRLESNADFRVETSGGRVSAASVTVTLQVVKFGWGQGRDKASPDDQAAIDKFFRLIGDHEGRHLAIHQQGFAGAHKKLLHRKKTEVEQAWDSIGAAIDTEDAKLNDKEGCARFTSGFKDAELAPLSECEVATQSTTHVEQVGQAPAPTEASPEALMELAATAPQVPSGRDPAYTSGEMKMAPAIRLR
jgi:hypothetical protein